MTYRQTVDATNTALGLCDEWSGSKNADGYGHLKSGGKVVQAHRLVYMQSFGHIESWEYVCHACDNPACINLDHLWIGSAKDNAKDRDQKGRGSNGNAGKTHCKAGHEFTEENTYIHRPTGERQCISCRRDRARGWKRP
jgi:hypothetical protein